MLIYNPNKIHNSEFIIVITSLIYNSEFRIHNYDYRCSLRVKRKSKKLTTNYANDTNYLAIILRVFRNLE